MILAGTSVNVRLVDGVLTQLADVAADFAWLLGNGAVPWLLLVAVVLVRPPAIFSGLAAVIRASRASRSRYLSSLRSFRTELAGRAERQRRAQADQAARPLFGKSSWRGLPR